MKWLIDNASRILIYGALALALAMVFELDGFRRGELKLFRYQADQLRERVAVVVKQAKVDTDATAMLQNDLAALERTYADYIGLHNSATTAALADAARHIRACPDPDGERPDMRNPARMLAEVESAVLEIVRAGDQEIIKLRNLYARDVKQSQVRP